MNEVLEYLHERFGLEPSLFEDYVFYLAPKGRVYLGPKNLHQKLVPVSLGLMIARNDGMVKPTTNLLQAFGRHVKKNVVQLSKGQSLSFLKGDDVRLVDGEAANSTEGYVLVKYLDYALGCALLKTGLLRNMLPKAKRLDVKYI